MMSKTLAILLSLSLFAASSAQAQINEPENVAVPTENELDKAADNLNIAPPELRLKLKREVDSNINLKLKNSTKGEIKDMIKVMNYQKRRSAGSDNQSQESSATVDPNDKKAVSDLLQKDFTVETDFLLDE